MEKIIHKIDEKNYAILQEISRKYFTQPQNQISKISKFFMMDEPLKLYKILQ